MFPVLFRIGSLPINSYGVTLALSFVLGVKLAVSRAARLGIPASEIADLAVWVMISAIAGSRFFYVATHTSEFSGHWLDTIAIWKGLYGLSMLGGVMAAVATGIFVIRRRRWPLWSLADACIPSFALGIMITRIGCFLNGCCFGSETGCLLGVSFPQGSLPWSVYGSAPLHPTQLYASLKGLYLLAIVLMADRRPHFPGFSFCLFMSLYGASRFGLEEFRHFDHATNGIFGYSVFAHRPGITDNQLISLLIIASALLLGLVLGRRAAGARRAAGTRG
ncbi:prolipoprotein diacylglyceryl transferase [Candidatus Fermentibacteria bacterium]|nr:prolipoprotein diacylglyceryl transferase [Candidatus Fermentibacteria bacterium]